MELKDFVADILVQICEGIQQAKEETKDTGARIAPVITSDNYVSLDKNQAIKAQLIHFDVDIAEEKKSDKSGGIKVLLNVISANGSVRSTSQDQSTHHVSFDIPVVWSTSGVKKSV